MCCHLPRASRKLSALGVESARKMTTHSERTSFHPHHSVNINAQEHAHQQELPSRSGRPLDDDGHGEVVLFTRGAQWQALCACVCFTLRLRDEARALSGGQGGCFGVRTSRRRSTRSSSAVMREAVWYEVKVQQRVRARGHTRKTGAARLLLGRKIQ